MQSFDAAGHGRGIVETKQVVSIVDQHIEFAEKILAEDTAKKVEIDGMGILEVKHEYLLIGDGMGADFEQVELREGSGCKKSDSCYPGRALSIQMELSSQGWIDHRHLGAGVQQKVVGAGMVYGYLHDHLVAVYKTEGYTCDISRAMRFCGKCWDDGCGRNEGSEPLEGRHFELLSRSG